MENPPPETPVPHAPVGSDATLTIREDLSHIFAPGDFGYTDADADAFAGVIVESVPMAGVLRLGDTPVSAGQTITEADAGAGKLVFVPAPNASGNPYASVQFRVQDASGALDATTRTLSLVVTSVNDAPSGEDRAITRTEDSGNYVFSLADFALSDTNDSPQGALLAVQIDSLPSGALLNNGAAAVSIGDRVLAADIAAGTLVLHSAAGAFGDFSFTFQVQDDGGTANGGSDLDPTFNTFALQITSVNDAPTGASKTIGVNEDSIYTFQVADFGFSDGNDTPSDALLGVEIASLPAAGALTLSGNAFAAGQLVSAAAIAGGELRFAPQAGAFGTAYASFAFHVRDTGGGADRDETARTITIDVSTVNDVPSGTNGACIGSA